MHADRPLFELEGGEDWTDLSLVSFVDLPAIKREFFTFDSFQGREPFRFSSDRARQIVTGPVLIPELIIPRRIKTEQGEALINVVFRSDQIPVIYERFMQKQGYMNTNLMHGKEPHDPEDCYMLELWMSDQERGVLAPRGFEDLPDKTIYASYKITSPGLWKRIEAGEIRGFSLEGRFKMKVAESTDPEAILQAAEKLQEVLKNW